MSNAIQKVSYARRQAPAAKRSRDLIIIIKYIDLCLKYNLQYVITYLISDLVNKTQQSNLK